MKQQIVYILGLTIISLLILFTINNQSYLYVKESQYFSSSSNQNNQSQQILQRQINCHKQNNSSQCSNKQAKIFNIQKKLWIYQDFTTEQTEQQVQIFKALNFQNTKFMAQQDNYSIYIFNSTNYHQYLSKQAQSKISSVKQILEKKFNKNSNQAYLHPEYQSNSQTIFLKLIKLFLLSQNGGIIMQKKITVIQKFSTWINNIIKVPYINVGDKINSQIQPKCFAFYQANFSSFKHQVNVKRQYEFQKKIVIFPAVLDNFIACSKGSLYIQRLIQLYINILTEGQNYHKLSKLNKGQKFIGLTNPSLIYKHGLLLANHIVLQQKQFQLDQKSNHPNSNQTNLNKFKNLAIDDFGLVTMNRYAGIQKLTWMFKWDRSKCFQFLSKPLIQETQRLTGKLRFMFLLHKDVMWTVGRRLKYLEEYVHENSFVKNYFYRYFQNPQFKLVKQKYSLKYPHIQQIKQNNLQNTQNSQWTGLNKNIFVIWSNKIIGKSNLLVQLCYYNLKRSAQNSGFTFHSINNQNIKEYIGKQMMQQIDNTIKNATYTLKLQTISDLYRLALIYKHGGVYIDASTFTVAYNFNWILDITKIPNKFIWNRYGKQPDVLLFWNSFYGSPTDWKYDRQHDTKSQSHLSYETNFIAAKKGSSYIKEWFQVFSQWITTPYQKIQNQLKDLNLIHDRWTTQNDRYLLVMEAAKYVSARRQKYLNDQPSSEIKGVSDYYKIWSLPGQMIGQQKFRSQMNYQSTDYRFNAFDREQISSYKHEYSEQYVNEFLGPVIYQTKFYGSDMKVMNMRLLKFYEQNKDNFTLRTLDKIIHPKSILGKLLYGDGNDKRLISLLQFYNNQAVARIENIGNKILGL